MERRWVACKVEADWLKGGRQGNDWTRVMKSVLRLKAWESGSDVKSRKAA